MLTYELNLIKSDIKLIAGIDEVGRGCLAGPMVVGAVILNPNDLLELHLKSESSIKEATRTSKNEEEAAVYDCTNHTQQLLTEYDGSYTNNIGVSSIGIQQSNTPRRLGGSLTEQTHSNNMSCFISPNSKSINNDVASYIHKYKEIKDSKLLSAKKREELSTFILEKAVSYSIFFIDNKSIDKFGISKCTQIAFFNAVKNLHTKPKHILTDAFAIKTIKHDKQTNIISGDKNSISIAAASIIAKVARDNFMEQMDLDDKYKIYNFGKHKGYGTKEHLDILRTHGASDMHRTSFNWARA